MTEIVDTPDTEYGAKKWAQTHPLLTALSGRVFFGMPDGEPAFPLLLVEIVSGYTDDEAPIDHPRLSWQCWGTTKKSAVDLRNALTTALRRCRGVVLSAGVYCYEVTDITVAWLPDDAAKLARYVVDATFHVRLG